MEFVCIYICKIQRNENRIFYLLMKGTAHKYVLLIVIMMVVNDENVDQSSGNSSQ
jgi:hypothetical protein